jgi:hypothetical protein
MTTDLQPGTILKNAPPGPWTGEPDHHRWTSASGLDCVIHRVGRYSGHLCGYVRVPAGHLFHGRGYDEAVKLPPEALERVRHGTVGKRGVIPFFLQAVRPDTEEGPVTQYPADIFFDVHGSLTWAAPDVSGEPRVEGEWWFGFDCAHAGDLSPMRPERFFDESNEYRDWAYVMAECESLAAQLTSLTEASA